MTDMSVSFGQLWFSNVAFGILVVAVYSILMWARSISARDRTLDGHGDWLSFVASMTVTVAIGVAFCADVYWVYGVLVK